MGRCVNTNLAGLDTTRILRGSTRALNKSLQRPSSALRIYTAGDAAAGLAIADSLALLNAPGVCTSWTYDLNAPPDL